jgi:glycerol kinase
MIFDPLWAGSRGGPKRTPTNLSQTGWVEHNPKEILESTKEVIQGALERSFFESK